MKSVTVSAVTLRNAYCAAQTYRKRFSQRSRFPNDSTPHGRGGSVSRRDHTQAAGIRTQRSGGTTYAEVTNSIASRSSGEGVWGRGASLREAASPPASPPKTSLFGRGPGGGASLREAAFPGVLLPPHGRGGSVSRRDHNQVYRRPTVLTGGTNFAKLTPPIANRSSGGGPGEGLLSEKPPPPASLILRFPK